MSEDLDSSNNTELDFTKLFHSTTLTFNQIYSNNMSIWNLWNAWNRLLSPMWTRIVNPEFYPITYINGERKFFVHNVKTKISLFFKFFYRKLFEHEFLILKFILLHFIKLWEDEVDSQLQPFSGTIFTM